MENGGVRSRCALQGEGHGGALIWSQAVLSAPCSVLVFFLGTHVPSEAGRQAEDAGSPMAVAGVGGWQVQRQGQQSGHQEVFPHFPSSRDFNCLVWSFL